MRGSLNCPRSPDQRIAAVSKLQSGPHSRHRTGLIRNYKRGLNQALNVMNMI